MEQSRLKIAMCLGTMPDIIKMAPLIWEGDKRGHDVKIVYTNQHFDKGHYINIFNSIVLRRPDFFINRQHIRFDLGDSISQLTKLFEKMKPDLVMVHGDTKTAMVGAVAAHFLCIPVVHIEAGLRTGTREPWPEQTDTRIADACSNLFFAATERSKNSLMNEGFDKRDIYVVGNTVVDIAKKVNKELNMNKRYDSSLKKTVYFSAHREENMRFKTRFLNIVKFANFLANEGYDVQWVMRNKTVLKIKEYHAKLDKRINIVESLTYPESIELITRSDFVCTDSGGLQEESSALHVPCLTMRYVTDRPETVEIGSNICTTLNFEKMKKTYYMMKTTYLEMKEKKCPYGSGNSSKKIFDVIEKRKDNLIRWVK